MLELPVGACFDDPDDFAAVTDVPIVSCDQAHDNEVVGMNDIARPSFPGGSAVNQLATEICVAEFESYVGVSYADSPLDVGWFGPTEESWDAGDREVICFTFDPSGQKLVGSVAADRF